MDLFSNPQYTATQRNNTGRKKRATKNRATKNRTTKNRATKRVSKKIKCREDIICNYGTFPIKEPMSVDDYSFDFVPNFLGNLEKIYFNIVDKNKKTKLVDSANKNDKNFLRDIMTAYVVSNIFKIQNQNKLIHIINKIMKCLYEQFYKLTKIRLYFVYRGGNILKIYKTNFENILPGRTKQLFKKEFDEYFKNSDIDFYTIIHEAEKFTSEEIDKINQYTETMCYYGLYVARIFIMNNFNLFEFCSLNNVSFSENFKDIVEIMNNDKKSSKIEYIQKTNIIGLGFNKFLYLDDSYNVEKILKENTSFIPGSSDSSVSKNIKMYKKSGRFDLNIENTEDEVFINKIEYTQPNLFKERFDKTMKDLVSKNKILDFYISNNNLIEDKEESISFSLTRLMINFSVFFERQGNLGVTNTSSELFDLSIGHPEDKMYNVYNSKNIELYPFQYDDEKTDEIYIPNIKTTLTDLIKILFGIEYPWLDIKYEKRLYRLLLLTFVDQLSNSNVYDMEKILKSKNKRIPKNDTDISFETLNYRNQEIKKKAKSTTDKNKYKSYIKKYKNIVKKIINMISEIKSFIESEKQLDKKDIYNFTS